jgi:uncharacterized protein YlxP (DUF503 family)
LAGRIFGSVAPFVCLVELRLHFGEAGDLKAKRKLVQSLKVQMRQRFGASIAEVDGHDKWQRATLLCALVGDSGVGERGAALRRFAESRCPDGCSADVDLLSLRDIRG